MKKLVNNPDHVAAEMAEGMALAFPHLVRQVPGTQGVVRNEAPIQGKVAVVVGGGSGHEPMFLGYTGAGMATAGIAGNVFASPPPRPIFLTAKAAHGGAGVLFLYGNYAGDTLNFDAAVDMLQDEGIEVATVRVTDDIASAPFANRDRRRGIAGNLFVFKIAGARAEEGAPLAVVTQAAAKANDNTRSMGIALSSCIIPASGKPIFQLGEDEIELGMGIHGEPGEVRSKISSADEVTAQIVSRILADMPVTGGEEVAVLVNGLGATPICELYIMFRAVQQLLNEKDIGICRSYVGNYASSLDMAGCSVTVMKLDSELKRLLLAPANTPALVQV